MKLLELHIDGFGKFHDRTISLNDGINIIYGKNEAGKSTLHTFIRGMLFGIDEVHAFDACVEYLALGEVASGGAPYEQCCRYQ